MTITAVILTFNEERHLARCIGSLGPVVSRICVIDSFSTDGTVAIARAAGAEVFQNTWRNYSTQFQWGLDHAGIATDWTMRIDADEDLEPDLQQSITRFVTAPGPANAAYFKRKICFMGRPIRHGFFYPALMLRLWRSGTGRIETRWMDEHIVVTDAVATTLAGDLTDHNLNDLAWWTAKHVGYAKREAYDIIAAREQASAPAASLSGGARRKRWLKTQVYNRLPCGLRSGAYFLYRYLIGRGFLDGREGFYFHFLQSFWYRTYVDATLLELEQEAAAQGVTPLEMLRDRGIL